MVLKIRPDSDSVLTRVEPPITEHFPIFSSLLNQIEWFLCHWTRKLESYKYSFSVARKGAMWNVFWKRMSDGFEFFWKNSSRSFSSSSPIPSSLLVHFELFKAWWVCQLKLYKAFLYCRGLQQSKMLSSKF